MVAEIQLRCLLEPLRYSYLVFLCTGERVTIAHAFTTKRYLDGRYVYTSQKSFLSPLKPGDHYITEVPNVAIRFEFTKEHLTDPRGATYFYYKHLEKHGLVSIKPVSSTNQSTFESKYVDVVYQHGAAWKWQCFFHLSIVAVSRFPSWCEEWKSDKYVPVKERQ